MKSKALPITELYKFDEKSASTYIEFSNTQASRNYVKSLVRDGSIVDLGCGNGQEGMRYSKNFYLGIDISHSLLRVAKNKMKNNYFVQSSLENLPLKSKSVDFTLLRSILEHQQNLSTVLGFIFKAIKISKKSVFIVWHTPPKRKIWYQKTIVKGHLGRPIYQTTFPIWVFMLLFSFSRVRINQHEVWVLNARKKLGRVSK